MFGFWDFLIALCLVYLVVGGIAAWRGNKMPDGF
jgi:hypothetical protein